ncbi:MAG: 4Fe-4S binding protein [Parcubacteria group bacterium]|jgi:pyruvate ferredoxin oxidoreductase delta subunit|nr:4Fe-4S binding protein [Candidatus Moranbacteria bacterium]
MNKGSIIKHKIKNAADTGAWRNQSPYLDKKTCIGCGNCVKYCPDACIVLREAVKKGKKVKFANIDKKFCKGCGVCAQVCPVKAIAMK